MCVFRMGDHSVDGPDVEEQDKAFLDYFFDKDGNMKPLDDGDK